jgi:hypothetical protein
MLDELLREEPGSSAVWVVLERGAVCSGRSIGLGHMSSTHHTHGPFIRGHDSRVTMVYHADFRTVLDKLYSCF